MKIENMYKISVLPFFNQKDFTLKNLLDPADFVSPPRGSSGDAVWFRINTKLGKIHTGPVMKDLVDATKNTIPLALCFFVGQNSQLIQSKQFQGEKEGGGGHHFKILRAFPLHKISP